MNAFTKAVCIVYIRSTALIRLRTEAKHVNITSV